MYTQKPDHVAIKPSLLYLVVMIVCVTTEFVAWDLAWDIYAACFNMFLRLAVLVMFATSTLKSAAM